MNKIFCGIDLGTRSSSFCLMNEEKKVLRRWQGKNEDIGKELAKVKEDLYCIIEAGPLAESICSAVEKIGGKIEIVDSRHTKALLHGKKKTDKIDAQVLAELAQMGWYKPIYRKDGIARERRTILKGRATIVSMATRLKNTIRGLLKASGIVLPVNSKGDMFVKHVTAAIEPLALDVKLAIEDLLALWKSAHAFQKTAYRRLAKLAKNDKVAKRLMTVPGVGPATAIGFSSTIASHTRFKNAKQVASYFGLAPNVHQSGDTHYHGRVTKKGDSLMRWLMVEAAGVILSRVKSSFPLKEWALKLKEKKGGAKARVALARKLTGVLFTIWRKETDFVMQAA